VYAGAASTTRDQLKDQISALEAQLSAYAPAPSGRRRGAPRVLSTEELAGVRDELLARLEQLDEMRDDLVGLLASLRTAMGEDQPAPVRARATTARARPRPATSGS
jgi:hypothetical protein